MVRVFVDTSALIAVLDEGDPRHRDARQTFLGLTGDVDLLTHNYVVVETLALVRRRLGPDAEMRLLDDFLPIIETIWVDPATHRTAAAAYRAAARTASLVDHVSFEVMRAEGVAHAWAYDRDFEREGFALPPPGIARAPRVPRRLSEEPAQYESASDLVGVAEIAARSGRSVNTVQSWRRRHPDFPAPVATLAAAPVWAWSDVEPWVARRPSGMAEPTIPLFDSGLPELATRADDYLEGFGEP